MRDHDLTILEQSPPRVEEAPRTRLEHLDESHVAHFDTWMDDNLDGDAAERVFGHHDLYSGGKSFTHASARRKRGKSPATISSSRAMMIMLKRTRGFAKTNCHSLSLRETMSHYTAVSRERSLTKRDHVSHTADTAANCSTHTNQSTLFQI